MKILKSSEMHKPRFLNLAPKDFKRYHAASPLLQEMLAQYGRDERFFETIIFGRYYLPIINKKIEEGTCAGQTQLLCAIFNEQNLGVLELKQHLELHYDKAVQFHAVGVFLALLAKRHGWDHQQLTPFLCEELKKELFGETYVKVWNRNTYTREIFFLEFRYPIAAIMEYESEIKEDEKLRRAPTLEYFFEKDFPGFLNLMHSVCEINPGPFCFECTLGKRGVDAHDFFLAKTAQATFILYDSKEASFYEGTLAEVLTELLVNATKDRFELILSQKPSSKLFRKVRVANDPRMNFILIPILNEPKPLTQVDEKKDQEFKSASKQCEEAIRRCFEEELEKSRQSPSTTSAFNSQGISHLKLKNPIILKRFKGYCNQKMEVFKEHGICFWESFICRKPLYLLPLRILISILWMLYALVTLEIRLPEIRVWRRRFKTPEAFEAHLDGILKVLEDNHQAEWGKRVLNALYDSPSDWETIHETRAILQVLLREKFTKELCLRKPIKKAIAYLNSFL